MNYRHDLSTLYLHLDKLQARRKHLNAQLTVLARLNALHPDTASAKQMRGVEKRIKHVSELILLQQSQQLDMFYTSPCESSPAASAAEDSQGPDGDVYVTRPRIPTSGTFAQKIGSFSESE